MTTNKQGTITRIFDHQEEIIDEWLHEQFAALSARQDLISELDLRRQSIEFLTLFTSACSIGNLTDITKPEWRPVLDFLVSVSRSRAIQGFSPSETATFVFSLKQPLFARLRQEVGADAELLANELWNTTVLIDKLGLYTTEVYQKSREEIIRHQQAEMLELSTPVVKLWEGILAVPLIGTLDSVRTQVVMENLLQSIVDTGSSFAIVDITGVPTVDTMVAQHLLKTVSAAKLMGANCVISGIRPQIAQSMVHLGLEFSDVVTKATLADALAYALRQMGCTINKPA
ncbi:STAS domain-containing protein [Methylobacter sp. S3L5C]|uniref:STAS domain-containing protein n=1 Tax=Methylobacter sp. S3L5C TaxID=2839024 RepID=UPI001FAE2A24|nr:STAS domain-containing protein [Methylobacter sp. S3L5C]UOA07888.1 STAS domain-containing protein [Methylobacter sp. S3L5C]